jgi:hypothetical protein
MDALDDGGPRYGSAECGVNFFWAAESDGVVSGADRIGGAMNKQLRAEAVKGGGG